MNKEIISHIRPTQTAVDSWQIQSNEEHSNGVAQMASTFASEFRFSDWGMVLGLLHDKGKEQPSFQRYIRYVTGYNQTLAHSLNEPHNHAYVGALIAKKWYKQVYHLLSYPILGHHAGLYDYGEFEQAMKKEIPSDVDDGVTEVSLTIPTDFKCAKEDFHHLIRILYSCLVDADYLDTELFMNPENASLRSGKKTLAQLLPFLEIYLAKLKENAVDSEVNEIRNRIQTECLSASDGVPGFYSLTVPTGGGKTLSSLLWAMHHAVKYGKKRIIIAIPYTSIIVQTAQILRMIFGDENVLEHHSHVDPEQIKDKRLALQMKLATENWDYPIVVTTNVQLFESMFSNRPSSCRKLHNICNSVLILDEVQTFPLEYLQPIVDSLKTYRQLFGTSILFTTASLPALKGDHRGVNPQVVLRGLTQLNEIIPASFSLHDKLKRVELHFDKNVSTYDEIAERLSGYTRVLCVVNSRKDAQEIYSRLPQEGITLHLSRMMCATHIGDTLSVIKSTLQNDDSQAIRVISTQLIEAGVDIDFPVVFRQETGLDSILQAAGRCNREGKQLLGHTYVFRLNKVLPKGYITHCRNALSAISTEEYNWFAPDKMLRYFEQLYSRAETFDKAHIAMQLYKPLDFAFKTASQEFKLIKDNTITIVVNYKNSLDLINELKTNGPNYTLLRKLNQYSVNVRERDFKNLLEKGLIEEVIEGIYLLPDREQYDNKIGLVTESHWLEEILIK